MSVLEELRSLGFTGDMFVTSSARVRCGSCRHEADPSQLELHAIRRIEGASDPADEAAVLALACTVCGLRGTAVVRFGPEASREDDEVLRKVEDLRRLS